MRLMQCPAVTGQLLGVVVDCIDQIESGNSSLQIEDRVFSQRGQLVDIRRNGSRMGFLTPLALLFLLIGLSRRSVLCLRHHGMIAPIPAEGKPLGFVAVQKPSASCWSIAIRAKLPCIVA